MKFPEIGERQWVTIGIFALTAGLLGMASISPALWDVKLFEVILQGVVMTGLLSTVLAFHFSSSKSNETARENTGLAFQAMTAIANNSSPMPATDGEAAQTVADAAQDRADEVKK